MHEHFPPKNYFQAICESFLPQKKPTIPLPIYPDFHLIIPISIAFSVPCTIIFNTTLSNLQLNGFNASTGLCNKHNDNSVLPTNSQVSKDEIKLLNNKCNQCLLKAKNSSVKNAAHFKRKGSFFTHILCPECHERVHGSGSEIFFTVKSARTLHKSRLSLLLFTWIQTANPDQVIAENNNYY